MMWPFKTKRELPLIDLVKYEASLIRERDRGAKALSEPRPMPYMNKNEYTAAEVEQVEDNQLLARELWRRYSAQQ